MLISRRFETDHGMIGRVCFSLSLLLRLLARRTDVHNNNGSTLTSRETRYAEELAKLLRAHLELF
jgi:hypothetical protein